MEAIFDLFQGLERMSPGSRETTEKAFELLSHGRTVASIVEFGCGRGIATLPLAEISSAAITAVDNYLSFLQQLEERAAEQGLTPQISVAQRSMDQPWPDDSKFDVIWCEGAVYNIGLPQALELWQPLVSSPGAIGVSDLVWLTEKPDAEVAAFWQSQGVSLRSHEESKMLFASHGWKLMDSFLLPDRDWQNYYQPLSQRLSNWISDYPQKEEAQQVASLFAEEMRIYERFGHQYGYVFYLAEKQGS